MCINYTQFIQDYTKEFEELLKKNMNSRKVFLLLVYLQVSLYLLLFLNYISVYYVYTNLQINYSSSIGRRSPWEGGGFISPHRSNEMFPPKISRFRVFNNQKARFPHRNSKLLPWELHKSLSEKISEFNTDIQSSTK